MQRVKSPSGAAVSYETYGTGPALVLVHGAFSDHRTNWEFVRPLFEKQFTVYAIAVFLLGHSYGAQTALAAMSQLAIAFGSWCSTSRQCRPSPQRQLWRDSRHSQASMTGRVSR